MPQTKSQAKPSAKSTTKKTAAKAAPKKAAPKKKAKAAPKATAKGAKKKSAEAGEKEVTLDRRRAAERRDEAALEAAAPEAAKPVAKLERREKVNRRRQIDPTTCERDYSDAEVEFMNALDAYKRSSGRMFPTCSEVLEVVRGMGYVQLSPAELAAVREQRGDAGDDAALEESAQAEAAEALAESDGLRVD